MRSEPVNCFVELPDGTKKVFPTATDVHDREGSIDIYNDRIFLGYFKKGDFLSYWIDPYVAAKRKKQISGGGRSTRRK
jgi:hypothetical protein